MANNVQRFESLQLKPNILKGIIAMGYDKPNEVQDALLPILCPDPPSNVIMNNHLDQNEMVPFIIAMLQRIESSQNYTQALCICSDNQMANKVIEIGSRLAKFSLIKFGNIDIDVSDASKFDDHIIFVAPEQLNRLISDDLCKFDNIKVLMIIDTDGMFTEETQRYCKEIAYACDKSDFINNCVIDSGMPKTCQKLFLSPSVAHYAYPVAVHAIFLDFLQVPGSMSEIVQFYVRCRDKDEKYQIIRNNECIFRSNGKAAIIYSQHHETANWLAEKFKRDRTYAYVGFYSEEISVQDQIKSLKKSQRITTDALLSYLCPVQRYLPFVVNFDIPVNEKGEADFDTYSRRISRMGRTGSGIVINLVDSEESMETCRAIEKHFGKTIYAINEEDLNDFEIIDIDSKSTDEIVVSLFQKIFCRQEPTSLLSTRTFEELKLRPDFFEDGRNNTGSNKPSKFLEATATALCANSERNLMAQGQAGTGKTTAMFLIMMNRIDKNKKYPQVLCLVPTIELAFPTPTTASVMACNARIRWMRANNYSICRDRVIDEQVVIGTPKHVIDMMNGNAFDMEKISLFVLDDAHYIFSNQSLWNDFKSIVEKLSTKCQTMLFSTTYSVSTMEKALNFVKDPIVISLPRELELPQNITQFYGIYGNQEEKYQATLKLFKIIRIFEGIIFCNTKETALWLEKRLKEDRHGEEIGVISDDTSEEDRLYMLTWAHTLLITSTSLHDVFSFKYVIVVNFEMPIDQFGEVEYDTYLQRVSRTARFGRTGVAVNMIDENNDHEVVSCRAIEQHFGKKLHYLDF